jgi:putative redox protein
MMTAVSVQTDQGFRTIAKTDAYTWYADESVEAGGSATAPNPVEQLLGALGSCMAMTVQMYATRKKWPLEKIEVHLELQRFEAANYPAYQGTAAFIHEVRERIVLHGDQLDDEQRARLLEISTKCPVRRVLSTPTIFVEMQNTPTGEH